MPIDEIGDDPMTRDEAGPVSGLVRSRNGRGAMNITTNRSIRDWIERLAGDGVLPTAIPDRPAHRAHAFDIEGAPLPPP